MAVLLAVAPAAGMAGAALAAPGGSTGTPATAPAETGAPSFSDGVVNADAPVEYGTAGEIDPALESADGTVEVVVRTGGVDRASLQGIEGQAAIGQMKAHAAQTQQDVLRFAGQNEGIEVLERFWIFNGVLVEVDTSEVSLDELSRVQNVERVHANFAMSIPEGQSASGASYTPANDGYDTTYGLDQVNAPEVWSEYNTQGEGVDVAVLDTGVDPDHPDIDIQNENFVEVDDNGNVENVDPFDNEGHGTHVSGTVVGGNASGEYIGVAPDATLWHAKVLDSTGGGSFAQVAGGMEWAANQSDVEVVSMSLGAPGYNAELVEPAENIESAGKILVASAGNSGEGNSGNPGNYHTVISAGASNADGDIASFSSGEEVDATSAYPDAVDEYDWPDSYIVPDYAAPGVSVKSAQNGGGYLNLSGTSMAAPHISGAIALMLSASGDLDEGQVRTALSDTATAPVEDPDPVRYGDGIIDVKNATDQVALNQSVTGTVTDTDGTPIEGATVSTDQGFSATTNADGEYTVLAETGTVNVTASAFGAESSTATVEVGDNETVTQNFSLGAALDVALQSGQPDVIEGGDNASATAQAANLESYTAELGDGYSEENATLYVNGAEVPFGTPIEFDQPTDVTATVTVQTAEGTSGNVSVIHTFSGLGESVEVTTGPTQVYAEFNQVGVVADDGEYGNDVADRIRGEVPTNYEVTVIDSDTAIDSVEEYDVYVVQTLDESNAEAFTSATGSYEVGTVYLDQWGSGSNGIEARADALGLPAETDDGLGSDASYTNIASDHPIFAGIESDTVLLHSGIDATWFSGSDGVVLADSELDGSVQGSGVAVSQSRWDILAATMGSSLFVNGDEFTEEADTVLGNMVVVAANPPEPAGTVTVTDTTVTPGDDGSMTVETDVDNVSGYEMTLTFDPEKVEVTDVTGIDMADPVVNLSNDEGYLRITQAQATPIDDATFVEVEFSTEMANGEEATMNLVGSESAVYDANGSSYITNWDDGTVSVLAAELGDVNADGEITAGDAVILQRYIAGLPTEVPDEQIETLGDVNQDGQITSADVTLILQIVAGNEEPPESSGEDSQSVDAPTVQADSAVRLAG